MHASSLDQAGTSHKRSFGEQAHFVPLRGPCDSPRQNPGENTVVVIAVVVVIIFILFFFNLFIY